MTFVPRDYQTAAVEHLWAYFSNGGTGNPLIVMPTGTGKSLVIAMLSSTMLKAFPATRILVLTHVKELIANNFQTLMRLWPGAPAGIYSAGLNRRDLHCQITFAGIASVRDRVRYFGNVDIIIIDEAHRVSDDEAASYSRLINGIKALNPNLKVIGLTATDFRLGLGKLTEGELFTDVVFDLSSGEAFVWMLENGYLCPLKPKRTDSFIDTSNVSISKGEYVTKQLDAALHDNDVLDRALHEAVDKAGHRKHWLVFATSIATTEEIAEKLNYLGVSATFVHSKINAKERDQRVADFLAGKYQALVNKDILTTGFDFPALDCIIALRPTASPGLWVQMLGRGTRPHYAPGYDITTREGRLEAIAVSDKQDCLVLDFATNTAALGPINYPSIPKKAGKFGGAPPVKVCDKCGAYVPIGLRVCNEKVFVPETRQEVDCGFVFPIDNGLSAIASSEEIIRMKPAKPEVTEYVVHRMVGSRHRKEGRPDSVKVSYYCGNRVFNVWVGVEHQGYPLIAARNWWRVHSPSSRDPMPQTTPQLIAVFDQLRMPTKLKVVKKGKYPEVVDYDFSNPSASSFGGSSTVANVS